MFGVPMRERAARTVETIEVLEDALDDYDGTVLLVSHDRAFLREVATRVQSAFVEHSELLG